MFCFFVGGCQLHSRPLDAIEPAPVVAPPSYSLSQMHLQTVRGTLFLYTPLHVSFNDLSEPMGRAVLNLRRLIASHQISPTGPVLLVYHDPSEDPDKPFDVDIGVPVAGPVAPPFPLRITRLHCFHFAAVTYRGPIALLPRAYDQLLREMIEAGLVPSEQTRESYVQFRDAESAENEIEIEVGFH